jgi:hypothetical protein
MTSPDDDKRLDPRSNIFVIATLYHAGGSVPVRIRNMSANGALVEGASLPPNGSPITLCRGSLTVEGEIMWVDDGRLGLHFSAPTAVMQWLPGGKRGAQQVVADEMAQQARLGALPPSRPARPADSQRATASEEMLRLEGELRRAVEALAADPQVAARHPVPLQDIDTVAQALARLAAQDALTQSTVAPSKSSAAP